MKDQLMTRKSAEWLFDNFAVKFGARESQREEFINYFSGSVSDNIGHFEFRCLPKFGFGGKLRWDGYKLYASCYMEDSTPDGDKLLKQLNKDLAVVQPLLIESWGHKR